MSSGSSTGFTRPGQEPADRLEAALQRLVDAFPGRAGVAVRHVDSGIGAAVDAATSYPMASTYKVPILVEMMARIEAGELTMDTEIELQPSDQHIGSGLLQELWAPGMTLSLRNLAAGEMNDLLVRIARGEILTAESCDVIIEILKKTQTGTNRLRGLLPSGIPLAHKTGTIGRVVDDVGIVWLPEGRGRFAISVYTLAHEGTDYDTSERLIADLARTSYDFFLFHSSE